MKKSLLISLLSLGLLAAGCSSSNKAATPENSSAPAASSDNSSAPASSASTSSSSAASSSNPDQHFISEAAKGNRAEVELGKMMTSKTTDMNVKKFAKMMVDDH